MNFEINIFTFPMSPQNNNNIFIIVPVFNEKKEVLEQTISELLKTSYRIVVVNDASAAEIILPCSRNIYLLQHAVNLGQGAALQTGIEFALSKEADYLVTFDADGQHSTADIQDMLAPLQNKEAEITLASRFLKPGHHNASLPRKTILKTGRWINYFFTGLYLSDAHNGLRAMSRNAAEKIILKENRMAHATEILSLIKKHKLKYKEVPATVTYTEYSKNKGQSVFNSIRIFFDLVLHKLFE
jgi:polyprenyl-phospho-N-acetylgalactosaminyl synthase